jgi:hypothetical protein
LVGCEESQEVCKAFRAKGHEAYSCDLLDCSGNYPQWHFKKDVFCAISDGWDLIILHPPCTALAVSGNAWYGKGMQKHRERIKAVKWTVNLFDYAKNKAKKVAMENPVGVLPIKPSQYIQPWQFGHPESKKTGFWLHELPLLKETDQVKSVFDSLPKNKQQRLHYLPPSKDRAKIRSKTFPGIAKAMAEQWGAYD